MYVPLALLILGLWALAWSYVFRRVGWSPWLALLMAVPLVNVMAFVVFVMNRWPIEVRMLQMEREISRLRENAVIIDVTPKESRPKE